MGVGGSGDRGGQSRNDGSIRVGYKTSLYSCRKGISGAIIVSVTVPWGSVSAGQQAGKNLKRKKSLIFCPKFLARASLIQ